MSGSVCVAGSVCGWVGCVVGLCLPCCACLVVVLFVWLTGPSLFCLVLVLLCLYPIPYMGLSGTSVSEPPCRGGQAALVLGYRVPIYTHACGQYEHLDPDIEPKLGI